MTKPAKKYRGRRVNGLVAILVIAGLVIEPGGGYAREFGIGLAARLSQVLSCGLTHWASIGTE